MNIWVFIFSLHNLFPEMAPGKGRSAKAQAGYQIAGLAVALGISVIGGIITGRVASLV